MVVGADTETDRLQRADPDEGPGPPVSPRWWTVAATVMGGFAIVIALCLPFAPVLQERPVLSWPADPSVPVSTSAMLTAYRPLTLDVSSTCETVRSVSASATDAPPRIVLATALPGSPLGADAGLFLTVDDDVLTVTSRGVVLARDPVRPGPCRYTVSGSGTTVGVDRDGVPLGAGAMPDVDVLVTDVGPRPGGAGLEVTLTVDNRFSTVPTPAKLVLLCLGAVAALGATGLLVVAHLRERRLPAREPRSRRSRRRMPFTLATFGADAVVFVALGVWVVIGPLTPDDGYYSAMATNAGMSGYVGNYYQLYNQGFTPFTWIYEVLGWWQDIAGRSPIAIRVPSVVLGMATWVAVRRLVLAGQRRGNLGSVLPASSFRGVLTLGVAAAAFLAWWLPFNLGTRPEPVIALSVTGALLAVVLAVERRSLLWAGVAVAAASLGATAAPTGLLALAPLLAASPRLGPVIRGTGRWASVPGRLACVLAPGFAGAVTAFADGSWHDFIRAQTILSGIQTPKGPLSEWERWQGLVVNDSVPSGARAVVIVTVLALLVAAGIRLSQPATRRLSARTETTAATMLMALLLLAPTPSKPWMHFGALAGVGAVLLAGVITGLPRTALSSRDGATTATHRPRHRSLTLALMAVAALATAGVLAFAAGGVNRWWLYGWESGLTQAGAVSQVFGLRADRPWWWALLIAAFAGGLFLLTRRRHRSWRGRELLLATVLAVVAFLAAIPSYLTATVALQAARTADGSAWSLAGQNVRDPQAANCALGTWIETADPDGPRLLPASGTLPPPPLEGFLDDGGWVESFPPSEPTSPGPGPGSWGSLVADPDAPNLPADASTGVLVTPWFQLPVADPTRTPTSAVTGLTGAGNELRAEYGRRSTAVTGVEIVGSRPLVPGEEVSSTIWRRVDVGSGPAGADLVRLVAVDARADLNGWLAVTTPRVSTFRPIRVLASDPAATDGLSSVSVALPWQAAALFPCLRQPRATGGITEPAEWAVGIGAEPLELLGDGSWQTGRGGLFGQNSRVATVGQWVARVRGLAGPEGTTVQVYRLEQPYAAGAYTAASGRVRVSGLTGAVLVGRRDD